MAEAELLELLLDEVEDAEEESDEPVDEDEEPEVELALAAQVADAESALVSAATNLGDAERDLTRAEDDVQDILQNSGLTLECQDIRRIISLTLRDAQALLRGYGRSTRLAEADFPLTDTLHLALFKA